jgi:hypothetical protein
LRMESNVTEYIFRFLDHIFSSLCFLNFIVILDAFELQLILIIVLEKSFLRQFLNKLFKKIDRNKISNYIGDFN